MSYSNALLTDFHFFSCLENSYLLKSEEGRTKLLLSSFVLHKFKLLGTNFYFSTKILTFGTFEVQNSFPLTYLSVITFKNYIKMNTDLFLVFYISAITNEH